MTPCLAGLSLALSTTPGLSARSPELRVAELLRDSDFRHDLSPSAPRPWLELRSLTVEVEKEDCLLEVYVEDWLAGRKADPLLAGWAEDGLGGWLVGLAGFSAGKSVWSSWLVALGCLAGVLVGREGVERKAALAVLGLGLT